MRTLLVALLILIVADSTAQVFCIPETPFTYPELALRAGVAGVFEIHFDVSEFTAANIRIRGLDATSSNFLDFFKPSIIENLARLIYYADTPGVVLTIRYFPTSPSMVNADFVERTLPNEIRIVARRERLVWVGCSGPIKSDATLDTVFLDATVPYESGKQRKSNILIQRVFQDTTDSTIVLRSNYPELEGEIRSISNQYPRSFFLRYGPNASVFLIRFRVAREIDCGNTQTY